MHKLAFYSKLHGATMAYVLHSQPVIFLMVIDASEKALVQIPVESFHVLFSLGKCGFSSGTLVYSNSPKICFIGKIGISKLVLGVSVCVCVRSCNRLATCSG